MLTYRLLFSTQEKVLDGKRRKRKQSWVRRANM
jgi:hypothetical protein